jgi:hypothetical protein
MQMVNSIPVSIVASLALAGGLLASPRAAHAQVNGEADLKIVALTCTGPSAMAVGVPEVIDCQDTLHNNGPEGPRLPGYAAQQRP